MFFLKWLVFFLIIVHTGNGKAESATLDGVHLSTADNTFFHQRDYIDDEGNRTILLFNERGLLERKTSCLGKDLKIFECSILYDDNGNKIIENHEFLGNETPSKMFNFYWTYDSEGRIASVARGEGDELTHIQYAYEDNRVTAYVHDALDQCIEEYVWEWNDELHFWEPLNVDYPVKEKGELEDLDMPIVSEIDECPSESSSMKKCWNSFVDRLFCCLHYIERSAHHVKSQLCEDLHLTPGLQDSFQDAAQYIFGKYYALMGHTFEETEIGSYGEKEIDKVRVSYINGMLNTSDLIMNHAALISGTHDDVKVHYLFRPTEGWVWDVSRAMMIKLSYHALDFRSKHAYLLAEHWRNLIDEMGGVDGGGVIIHYAHSLGGAETDRARDLLRPEEQKMIRVITLGSPTLIKDSGFESVINHISANDGVSVFDPIGLFTHWFSSNSNVFIHGTFGISAFPIIDHSFDGKTYRNIMKDLGRKFIEEFGS